MMPSTDTEVNRLKGLFDAFLLPRRARHARRSRRHRGDGCLAASPVVAGRAERRLRPRRALGRPFPRGRFVHAAISKAEPVEFELGLGWLTHYLVGIAFAGLLVAVQGVAWLEQPTFAPALLLGVATVAAPWFVMQPAMGAGFAATKTPTPLKNCLRSLANHTVFGAGLYLAAAALAGATA